MYFVFFIYCFFFFKQKTAYEMRISDWSSDVCSSDLMSHGSVILAMEDPIPPSLVGHPVEVRFIDTDSLGGEALATVFGTLSDLIRGVLDPITAAFAAD